MDRLRSGIFGLDKKIGGGLVPNSINIVIGTSGTGKSIYQLQFAMQGLREGSHALYISQEESTEQLLREAENIGFFDIRNYYESGKLVFYETDPSQLYELVTQVLPNMVNEEYSVNTRIVIDPLTPLLWQEKDKTKQRLLISNMFRTLRQLGVTMCSVEEMGIFGEKSVSGSSYVPLFLSDTAFLLQNIGTKDQYGRSLRVVKHRSSPHEEQAFPLNIVNGFGIVILQGLEEAEAEDFNADLIFSNFEKEIESKIEDADLKQTMLYKLYQMRQTWKKSDNPYDILSTALSDVTGPN